MKKLSLLFLMLAMAMALTLTGCSDSEDTTADEPSGEEPVGEEPAGEEPADEEPAGEEPADATGYDDGRYRGIYADRDLEQVGIQFEIEDNVFTDVSFRQLAHGGNDYRAMEEGEPMYALKQLYVEAAEYLVGKPLEAVNDLYSPGDIIDDIDGFSSATIRANKIVSAINDGLNRGLYVPAGEFSREIGSYDDGRYRGIYSDRSLEQVGIQFEIEDNVFTDVGFRQLAHGGNDYRGMEEGEPMYALKQLYEEAADYLVGKPLEAVFDLHSPGDIIEDIDGFSSATIRSNKIFSAVMDGLNRGLYVPAGEFSTEVGSYDDGRYRGTYGDRDLEQVGVQFEIEDNVFTSISFRQLAHGGNDYRGMEEGEPMYALKQLYEEAAEYLVGKPLEAVYDLHTPGEIIDDIDGFSSATIRSNKIFSAIMDGLNRGLY